MTTPHVLFFGTHPHQSNGYSKVVYELFSLLGKNHTDIKYSIFGFQKFTDIPGHRADFPTNIGVYDAFEKETPRHQGFGVTEVREHVKQLKPDVCVVYNDMSIIHQIVTQLKLAQNEDGLSFKIIVYLDQVYLNQRPEYIDFVNKNADHVILFTKYWQEVAIEQGITLPTDFLPHGFNQQIYYPIPKELARLHYGLGTKDFIILNLNRNQPRKRWDICLKAFAEIVSRYPREPIRMVIGTATQGAWNLIEIFERELKKRKMTLQDGMAHLIILNKPQRLSDEDTNVLYNIADIGINTCDGEGFGMCSHEQGGIGIPQICPKLGGFLDFFDETNSIPISPSMAYYVDSSRDSVCGEALLCNYIDFVEAIEKYYFDRDLIEKHGKAARERIIKDYRWSAIAQKFHNICMNVAKKSEDTMDLVSEVEKIDLEMIKNLVPDATAAVAAVEPVTQPVDDMTAKAVPIAELLKNSESEKPIKKKKNTKEELKKLQKKLAKLLAEDSDGDSSDEDAA